MTVDAREIIHAVSVIASPHAAPAAVRPRHQMPRTSSGHSVDAATANTNPTDTAAPWRHW